MKQDVMLRSLLQAYHGEDASQLVSYLPTDEQERLTEITPVKLDTLTSPIEAQIGQVHYSWIDHSLEDEPEGLRPLFKSETLPAPIRRFFRQTLRHKLEMDHVLAPASLPERPLNMLLHVEKRRLIRLIGFLGLRDLACELRKTVDRRVLVQIKELLTPQQQRFLESCVRQQDPYTPPPSGIKAWMADRNSLNRLAQARGLSRLGKALSIEDSSLIWHLAHKLDAGRGTLLQREAQSKHEKALCERLGGQAIELLNRLENGQ